MEKTQLELDYQYFLENKEKFCLEYPDKFLAIKNKEIIGIYDDLDSAISKVSKEHAPGTFIIQQSSPNATKAQVFRSRIVSF